MTISKKDFEVVKSPNEKYSVWHTATCPACHGSGKVFQYIRGFHETEKEAEELIKSIVEEERRREK